MEGARESLDEVLAALASFVEGEVAATTMALGALRTLAHCVVTAMPPDLQAGETLLVGVNIPDVGWINRFDNADAARANAADVAPAGATSRRLTQQLIVTIHTGVEHEYRRRIAVARGLRGPNDLKCNFFRDITRLRNDFIHHHGVATARSAGNCSPILRTIHEGNHIYLDDRELLNIRFQIPWADLSEGSLDRLP